MTRLAVPYFSFYFLLKRMSLGKKTYVTLNQACDFCFPTNFIRKLCHSTKNSASAIMNVVGLSRKVPQILSDFNKT